MTLRGRLFLSLLALLGLIAGVISLGLLRQTDRFFRAFAQRHRSIRLIREADPVVKIPDGRTPVERLARYLVQSNPRIESRVKEDPASIRYRGQPARPGRSVPFDLVVDQPSGVAFRIFGVGEGGFAVVARMGPDAPTLEDVRTAREIDVVSAASKMVTIPSRAILLRTQSIPLPRRRVRMPSWVTPWSYGAASPLTGSRSRSSPRVRTVRTTSCLTSWACPRSRSPTRSLDPTVDLPILFSPVPSLGTTYPRR